MPFLLLPCALVAPSSVHLLTPITSSNLCIQQHTRLAQSLLATLDLTHYLRVELEWARTQSNVDPIARANCQDNSKLVGGIPRDNISWMSQDDTKPSLKQHQIVSRGNARQHPMLPWDNLNGCPQKGFARWCQVSPWDNLTLPPRTYF
jgi:hypothetical protein